MPAKSTVKLYALITISAFFFNRCTESEQTMHVNEKTSLRTYTGNEWESLARKKMVFGHQSVGDNIINGLQLLIAELHPPVQIPITAFTGFQKADSAGIQHFYAGKNRDPISKIDHFRETILKSTGDSSTIAFLKFCYVDIGEFNADKIDTIYKKYVAAVDEIKLKRPDVRLIHFTVPLKTRDPMKKGRLASLQRRIAQWSGSHENDPDNILREHFNEKIRSTYPVEQIFDIAAYESTTPSGERTAFKKGTFTAYSLYEAYSDDGGHLNAYGQKIIASKLLDFLIDLN